MTHKLVGKAERFLAQDGVASDDEGVLEAATLDQPLLHQILHILVVDKGAGGSNLARVDLRGDLEGEILGESAVVVGLGAGDLESIVWKDRHDRSSGGFDVDRLVWLEERAGLLLLHDTRLLDDLDVGGCTPVADRGFVGIHLDKGVVDPESRKGREDMLHGLDLGVPLH